jgi:hypothetical protein
MTSSASITEEKTNYTSLLTVVDVADSRIMRVDSDGESNIFLCTDWNVGGRCNNGKI